MMKSLVLPVSEHLRAWIAEQEPERPWRHFVLAFAAIWAVYDALDIYWGGTASAYWMVYDASTSLRQLLFIQWSLLIAQLAILGGVLIGRGRGRAVWILWVSVMILRAIEAHVYFGLNDFFYYAVTTFVLLQYFPSRRDASVTRAPAPSPSLAPAWPRRLMRYQTAWIYFATGMLKLSPEWLSGDHLWVRQNYLAQIAHWPYPQFFIDLVSRTDFNRWLAIGGATGELTLALLLVVRAPGWLTIGLATAMHGFAALALNVWFFGASMIAQVIFVSRAGRAKAGSSQS